MDNGTGCNMDCGASGNCYGCPPSSQECYQGGFSLEGQEDCDTYCAYLGDAYKFSYWPDAYEGGSWCNSGTTLNPKP